MLRGVAPYVGAWIETWKARRRCFRLSSHPMWVRGLKQYIKTVLPCAPSSHPMWVRGLKHKRQTYNNLFLRRTLCGCVD